MNARLLTLLVAVAIITAMFVPVPLLSAEDGAALYKAKCAACHGAAGAGKPPSVPALKGTSLSEAEITNTLTKGGGKKAPHTAAFKGLTEEQAKAIAAYVKSMQ